MSESDAKSALPLVVVGGGFAGVAAAWAGVRAGARVVLVHDRAGASELYSGIVDGTAGGGELRELAARLGLVLDSGPRAVASREGVVRFATGRDAAVLDLEALRGRHVAVADVGRDDWDAALLARSLGASPWARSTGTRFSAVSVSALASGAERRIAAYDFALALDSEERSKALVAALRAAQGPADGWLLGPWLGIASNAAVTANSSLGCPVGETSSAPGGAAGARFEQRRNALLRELGVEVHAVRVRAVRASSRSLHGAPAVEVELEGMLRLTASAVVLALGGVAAGGIELGTAPGGWKLSLDAPVEFELDGVLLDGVSSLAGVSLERVGLGALGRVGLRAQPDLQLSAGLRVYGAGDVLAGRERTVLAALASGLEAGRQAARASTPAGATGAADRRHSRSMS